MVKKQSAVGIFVLIGLICLGYLTVKLGKMEILGSNTYTVEAQFSSVQGLRNGANVEISGVQVGRVSAIELDTETYTAKISMKINNTVALSEDTMAAIKTSGLIGDKFVELTPGGSDELLAEGAYITDTEPPVDLIALISKYVFGSL
ncbi:outer membrane lipid asymmetry maintenance protein MlaD [Taurinivorans muris]|jgi:ABC-type transport system involved in resistance to organic solvents, periplasmic component|uniref:Outer membrane lipid asymmetry maintenance protein MlaD n=1 Tax=Taurinivorans muris TaxID=2787751 RepID=A0ABY5Y5H4_9BACT|nr:outer membrane lipid asymmetry maintenance protein MlaD [Mailhella sp.]UWX06612.1 outer membrane lipid asymmetry maintenance protein MlaD [Desulfovibrionaceae bacterium LT0009]